MFVLVDRPVLCHRQTLWVAVAIAKDQGGFWVGCDDIVRNLNLYGFAEMLR